MMTPSESGGSGGTRLTLSKTLLRGVYAATGRPPARLTACASRTRMSLRRPLASFRNAGPADFKPERGGNSVPEDQAGGLFRRSRVHSGRRRSSPSRVVMPTCVKTSASAKLNPRSAQARASFSVPTANRRRPNSTIVAAVESQRSQIAHPKRNASTKKNGNGKMLTSPL